MSVGLPYPSRVEKDVAILCLPNWVNAQPYLNLRREPVVSPTRAPAARPTADLAGRRRGS
jgi:hypothetical protein